jgi:hypothetical protein
LNGTDNDFGLAPIVAVLLEDHGSVVVLQHGVEALPSLLLQLKTVDEKENALCVSGLEEQLDDARRDQSLAGAGGHLKQEAVTAFVGSPLQCMNGAKLVGPQEAQLVLFDERGALG